MQSNTAAIKTRFSGIFNTPNFWRGGLLCLFIFLFSLLSPSLQAQNKELDKLREEKAAKEKRIALLEEWLSTVDETKDASREQVSILEEQITLIEEQLVLLKNEVVLVDQEIEKNLAAIEELEAKIEQSREEYGQLAFITYKALVKRPPSFYFLASKDLKEGRNRLRYIKEFQRDRVLLFERIKMEQDSLLKVREKLEEDRAAKKRSLAQEQRKNADLQAKKQVQQEMLAKLELQEEEYASDIQKLEQEAREIQQEIDRLMAEIARDRKKPEEVYDILPDIRGKFAQAKGSIPWPIPTSTGFIHQNFGMVTMPNGIKFDNKGVDFKVNEGQKVRAVFEGVVEKVTEMPIVGKVVVINHGEYLTMYTRLSEVTVSVGEKVEKLQRLGTAKTDARSGETLVHFRIYKEKNPLNPTQWLVRKK